MNRQGEGQHVAPFLVRKRMGRERLALFTVHAEKFWKEKQETETVIAYTHGARRGRAAVGMWLCVLEPWECHPSEKHVKKGKREKAQVAGGPARKSVSETGE